MSVSYVCEPCDRRCRSWGKTGALSRIAKTIERSEDIPGPYLRRGADLELDTWEWVIEGEQVHHNKPRGWDYWLHVAGPDDRLARTDLGASTKQWIKDAGAPIDLLRGLGEIAAATRAMAWMQQLSTEDRIKMLAHVCSKEATRRRYHVMLLPLDDLLLYVNDEEESIRDLVRDRFAAEGPESGREVARAA